MLRNSLIVAFIISLASVVCAAPVPEEARPHADRGPRRGLIHPLLDVDPSREFRELAPFQHKMAAEIERLRKEGSLSEASYYFRDLDNGPLMGHGENTPFKAASLLKVPVMFAVLKVAEKSPGFLDQKIKALPYLDNLNQNFKPLSPVTAGQEYTVRELLRIMITGSDNAAALTLTRTLTNEQYLEVFSELGLSIPNIRDLDDPVTVREYATFFRILYNASYLGRDQSQMALELLAAAEFKRGLTAGVPGSVTVAHKFGEAVGPDGLKQLHDCGIVYHQTHPYLLCMMTRGADYERLAGALASLSNLAYREVDAAARRKRDLVPSPHGRQPSAAPSRDR